MGSQSDMPHAQAIAGVLDELAIPYEIRIGSAHKTPEHVLNILRRYEADPRPKVYITVAGRSNALSGFTDGSVSAPVIACPPASEAFGGADVYSSLRMPSGVAPAVVLEPANAALLAAKILGQCDADVKAKVIEFQRKQAEKVVADDAAAQAAQGASRAQKH
jgi:5-(carboxyamino)imidazole ribonucleotide mutase/phosphoribosylaminoimidazole-succinocarboxamide synthase